MNGWFSRATVSDCVLLISALNDTERLLAAKVASFVEHKSREESFSYHACSTKKCDGVVRVVRSPDDHPGWCTACYIKAKEGL